MIFQDPMTSLTPGLPDRLADRRADPGPREGLEARRQEAGHRAAEAVGIPRAELRVDDYPHQFSGGMRQRVMIAMALSCNPSVLIADEPTTALDVTIQAQILELILQLREERGSAVVIITHDMGVVADVADRVLVMYAGKVVEDGPKLELFDNAQHPYTWGLLGSIPRLDRPKPAPPHDDPRPAAVAARPAAGLRLRAALRTRLTRPATRPVALEAQGAARRTATAASCPSSARSQLREPTIHPEQRLRDRRPLLEATSRHEALPGALARRLARGWRARCRRSTTCRFEVRAGRDARPGRRVGLRQVDARPLHRAAARADVGLDPVRRAATSRALSRRELRPVRRELQMVFQDPYASLNPRKRVGTIIGDPLRIHRIWRPAGERSARCRSCSRRSASRPSTTTATRTSSPAASASASASPARWRCGRS